MKRTTWKLLLAPWLFALAACAAGGSETQDDVDDGNDVGTEGGTGSDASTDAGQDVDGDDDAGTDAGEPDDGGDASDEDVVDGGEDPDADTGDADPGDADLGDADPGDAEPDAPEVPCSADQCFIDGACVDAGTLKADDACHVCLPSESQTEWTFDATSPACDGKPYWEGVTRALPTTPYGRKTAISCHNCYVLGSSNTNSLNQTLTKIHDAQAKGADLIELDIKDEGGVVYVQHDDNGNINGALFASVLADAQLKAGNQILFIESKETTASEAYVRKVLDALKAQGYATPGRPVVLRAFDNVSHNIGIAQKLLALPEYASIRPHVRLHVLFSRGDGNDIASLQSRIRGAKNKGFHGVEFEYQTPNLYGALKYAESLDLGINVWTIPTNVGEVYISSMRDEVDAITVDYPVDKARQVVIDDNGLVYLNVWKLPTTATSVPWYAQSSTVVQSTSLSGTNRPTLQDLGPGQPLFGTSLRFSGNQALPLYDGDNDPDGGFFVTAAVRFASLDTPEGTAVIVGKAQVAAFSLELTNDVLRFGVYVDDGYKYATYPKANLQVGPSYLITGAYDGDGGVWLWVNNNADATTRPNHKGGVKQNDVPIVIGADPEPDDGVRYFLNGWVQMALVQKWNNH